MGSDNINDKLSRVIGTSPPLVTQQDDWFSGIDETQKKQRFITIDLSDDYLINADRHGAHTVTHLSYAFTDSDNKGESLQGIAVIRKTQSGYQVQLELKE